MATPRKRSAIDEHWAKWQKRHRAPRAIDVLIQTRAKEAADRAEKKAADEVDQKRAKEAVDRVKKKAADESDVKKSF